MLTKQRLEEIKNFCNTPRTIHCPLGSIDTEHILELVSAVKKMEKYISNMCDFGCGQPGCEYTCNNCSLLKELFTDDAADKGGV